MTRRVGVVGLGHGLHLARHARDLGLEIVAGCDRNPARLASADLRTRYENWHDLLELGSTA